MNYSQNPLQKHEADGGLRSAGRSDNTRLIVGSVLIGLFSLSLPSLIEPLFQFILPQGLWEMLVPLSAALFGAALGMGVMHISNRRAALRMEMTALRRMEPRIWSTLLDLPLGFFLESDPLEIANRAEAASRRIRLVAKRRARIFPAAAIVLANLLFLIFKSPEFAAGSLALAVGLALVALLTKSRGKAALEKVHSKRNQLESRMREWIRGIAKIRMAGGESRIIADWQKEFQEFLRNMKPVDQGLVRLRLFRSAILGVSVAGLAALTAFAEGSTGNVLAMFAAYGALMAGVLALIEAWWQESEISSWRDAARPLFETPTETPHKPVQIGKLKGRIEFQNLAFRYEPEGRWILDGLTADIRPGEFVAIAGASGCGKSTLVRLLLGLHNPGTGTILFDGQDMCRLEPSSFRSQTGVVFQSPILFPGDLYQNLCGELQLPTEKVWEAIELAGLADEIRRLPLQLHTMVGLNGENFSAGQRQRIGLARALLMQPGLLLLDEATSALDSQMQTRILENLGGLGMTRILVTHRLTALRRTERILLLKNGRVTESGHCSELLERRGDFYELVKKQQI